MTNYQLSLLLSTFCRSSSVWFHSCWGTGGLPNDNWVVLQDMVSKATVFGWDWQVALCAKLWQHFILWHVVKLAANLPEKRLAGKDWDFLIYKDWRTITCCHGICFLRKGWVSVRLENYRKITNTICFEHGINGYLDTLRCLFLVISQRQLSTASSE